MSTSARSCELALGYRDLWLAAKEAKTLSGRDSSRGVVRDGTTWWWAGLNVTWMRRFLRRGILLASASAFGITKAHLFWQKSLGRAGCLEWRRERSWASKRFFPGAKASILKSVLLRRIVRLHATPYGRVSKIFPGWEFSLQVVGKEWIARESFKVHTSKKSLIKLLIVELKLLLVLLHRIWNEPSSLMVGLLHIPCSCS